MFQGLVYRWDTDPRASRILRQIFEYVRPKKVVLEPFENVSCFFEAHGLLFSQLTFSEKSLSKNIESIKVKFKNFFYRLVAVEEMVLTTS